jgi:hypothetical protein
MIAGYDVGTDTGQNHEYGHSRYIEYYALPACLAVRQKQEASLKINPFPPQIENFSEPRTG